MDQLINIKELQQVFNLDTKSLFKKLTHYSQKYSTHSIMQDNSGNVFILEEHYQYIIQAIDYYNDFIQTKETILSNKSTTIPFKTGSYVYFLIDTDDYIIYIGQTVNLALRISEHIRTKKPFNFVFYINVDNNDRLLIESVNINNYNPSCNVITELSYSYIHMILERVFSKI